MESFFVDDADMHKKDSLILSLIPDLQLKISEFLSVPDVKRLKWSCKDVNANIDMVTMITDIGRTDWKDDYDWKYFGMRLSSIRLRPLISYNDDLARPAILSFECKDQGWGNRKGRIGISELPNSQPTVAGGKEVGTIVAQSPIAEHEWGSAVLKFIPKNGFSYYLSYRVGEHGGHKLFMRSAKLQSVCIGGVE